MGFSHDSATPAPLPIRLLYDLDQTKIEQGAPPDQMLTTPTELIQEATQRWLADSDTQKMPIWAEVGKLYGAVQDRIIFIWWAYRIQQIVAIEMQRLGLGASYNLNKDISFGIDLDIYNLVADLNPVALEVHMNTPGAEKGARRRWQKREKAGIVHPHARYVYRPRADGRVFIPTAWDILRQINGPCPYYPGRFIVVPPSLLKQAQLFKDIDENGSVSTEPKASSY